MRIIDAAVPSLALSLPPVFSSASIVIELQDSIEIQLVLLGANFETGAGRSAARGVCPLHRSPGTPSRLRDADHGDGLSRSRRHGPSRSG